MALTRLLVLGLLGLATPAQSLSCLPPDPVRSYLDREGQPDQAILFGSLNFDPQALVRPEDPHRVPPDDLAAPANFRGQDLLSGERIEGPVTLVSRCLGPWCGGLHPGDHLVFATRTPEGITVTLDPCATAAFAAPDLQTLARLERCLRQGMCETR